MAETGRSEQGERQSQHGASIAVSEGAEALEHAEFIRAYTSGPTKGNAAQSYIIIKPNCTIESAYELGSRYLRKVEIANELARLAHSARISAEWVLAGLYEEGERRTTTKRKRIFDESGTQVSETIEEVDHDRVPALSLAAELTGQKRNVTAVALAVSVHIGGIDD